MEECKTILVGDRVRLKKPSDGVVYVVWGIIRTILGDEDICSLIPEIELERMSNTQRAQNESSFFPPGKTYLAKDALMGLSSELKKLSKPKFIDGDRVRLIDTDSETPVFLTKDNFEHCSWVQNYDSAYIGGKRHIYKVLYKIERHQRYFYMVSDEKSRNICIDQIHLEHVP